MKIIKKILKRILLYFGLRKITNADKRYMYMQKMFGKIAGIKGDIVECGVGQTNTFRILAEFLKKEGTERKLWGLDSFEGFPEPSVEDMGLRNPKKGEWKYIDAEDVPKILVAANLKKPWIDSHVKIVKGYVEETLPDNDIPQIALLHLDLDLYSAYKTSLKYLFPKVVKGGVILFDEYMNASENIKFPGAKKAIDEYFQNTEYKLSRDKLSGKYFMVKT